MEEKAYGDNFKSVHILPNFLTKVRDVTSHIPARQTVLLSYAMFRKKKTIWVDLRASQSVVYVPRQENCCRPDLAHIRYVHLACVPTATDQVPPFHG